MNDSFRKSCTIQLTPSLDSDISLNVSVPGSGVHPGYVYMIQAVLHTADGNQIKEDLTAVGMYSMTICDQILENSSKSHMKYNVFLHVFDDILHSFSNLSIEFNVVKYY